MADTETVEADDESQSIESEPTSPKLLQDEVVSSTIDIAADAYKIVAAIDFGTAFSGYAYTFLPNTEKIYTNRNWGQTQGFLLHKTPTCLLLRPDGEFEAFGFEAVLKYNDLCEEDAGSYYFFDKFKMKLYENKVRVITKLITMRPNYCIILHLQKKKKKKKYLNLALRS
jgi:hypothetical protein